MNNRRLFLLLMVLGILLISISFLRYGYENTWRLWNIPVMSPSFADFRVITSGIECHRLGYDPLIYNPCDPWQRNLNYPRIWVQLYRFGINQDHTDYFGVSCAVIFLVGISLIVPKKISYSGIGLLIITLFSPAILLGFERGNIDLLIFFLLSCAIFLNDRSYLFSIGLIFFSFFLKIFPIVALSILLRENKYIVAKWLIFTTLFLMGYILIFKNELQLIKQATPKGIILSYGFNPVWMMIEQNNASLANWVKIILYIAFLGLLVFCVLTSCFKKYSFDQSDRDKTISLDGFRVGSSIYIFTFLLGNNWDYRLMFLLFTIPQLSLWFQSSSKLISRISYMMAVSIIISTWFLKIQIFDLDQMAKWFLFFSLVYLFVYSAPNWIKQSIIILSKPLFRYFRLFRSKSVLQ